MTIPQPSDELEPQFNPVTTDAADTQSPIDDSYPDIEIDIPDIEPQFNPITTEAAEPLEKDKD